MAWWQEPIGQGLGNEIISSSNWALGKRGGSSDTSKTYMQKLRSGAPIAGHLPLGMQWFVIDPVTGKKTLSTWARGLMSGSEKYANLLANPGSFGGNIAEAIAPRLAMEQEMIGRNTTGAMQNAAGGAARSGTAGTGIAQALQAAIQQAGNRDKATSVRTAQMDSAQLIREDLDRLMQAYSQMLNWYHPKGRQGQTPGDISRQQGQAARSQNTSAGIGAIGSIVSAMASDKRLKYDITELKPVQWKWNRAAAQFGKEPGTTEEGLLAQDVRKVWPDAVVRDPATGYLGVKYQTVATRLAQAVQSVAAR